MQTIASILVFMVSCLMTNVLAAVEAYTVEGINDREHLVCPVPPPRSLVTRQFAVTKPDHVQRIEISSPRIRNVSISIANVGQGVVNSPYLYGPLGWDFRRLPALSDAITEGATGIEGFIRLHQALDLLSMRTETSGSEGEWAEFDANPLRSLNQYGMSMCSQTANILNNLARAHSPAGSWHGRIIALRNHEVGEACVDGSWVAFDAQAESRWIFYGENDHSPIERWQSIANGRKLISRVQETLGWSNMNQYLDGAELRATGATETMYRGREWNFDYDLRPNESLTMYCDMRGRHDAVSRRYNTSDMPGEWNYRSYSDYASAVFSYRPSLTGRDLPGAVIHSDNVAESSGVLVQRAPSRPASITLKIKSPWGIVGADIMPDWRTQGRVYVARAPGFSDADMEYGENLSWCEVTKGTVEYGNYLEGRLVYLVKLEFEGKGSALRGVEVATEVQVSPWSMPRLSYGMNQIRCSARNMNGSQLNVTYGFDVESDWHFHERATADYGRHIPCRIGGDLYHSSRKGLFWRRLKDGKPIEARIEIFQVSPGPFGRLVRVLKSEQLKPGYYDFYWDGRDGEGNLMPTGMYCYRITEDGVVTVGHQLYLFKNLWPKANESPAERKSQR